MQTCMVGVQVIPMEFAVGGLTFFTSATSNFDIITLGSKKRMSNNAIFGNIGHFDNAVDMAGLEKFDGIEVENIIPQMDSFFCPCRHAWWESRSLP